MFVVEINTCKAPTRSLGLGLGLGLGLDVAVAVRQRALNFFFCHLQGLSCVNQDFF